MRFRANQEEEPEVDLAPLIDCVFLLLIFFLVATQLSEFEEHLEFSIPPPLTALHESRNTEFRDVSLLKNGTVIIHNIREGLSELPMHDLRKDRSPLAIADPALAQGIRAIAGDDPNIEIRLVSHPEVGFQTVVDLVDLFKLLGLSRIEIRIHGISGDFQ